MEMKNKPNIIASFLLLIFVAVTVCDIMSRFDFYQGLKITLVEEHESGGSDPLKEVSKYIAKVQPGIQSFFSSSSRLGKSIRPYSYESRLWENPFLSKHNPPPELS